MEQRTLVELILRHAAAGRVDAKAATSALSSLAEVDSAPPALAPLALALEELAPAQAAALVANVTKLRLDRAFEAHRLRAAGQALDAALAADLADLPLDAPIGWATRALAFTQAQKALELERDLRYLRGQEVRGLDIELAVERTHAATLAALAKSPVAPWAGGELDAIAGRLEGRATDLAEPLAALRARLKDTAAAAAVAAQRVVGEGPDFTWPPDADAPALLAAALARIAALDAEPAARRPWLDRLLAWPSDAAASAIAALCVSPWEQQRAALVMVLRHGGVRGWAERRTWIAEQERAAAALARSLAPRAAEILLLWCRVEHRADPALELALERHCAEHIAPTDVHDFVRRWQRAIDPSEANLLRGIPLTAAPDIPTHVPTDLPTLSAAPAPQVRAAPRAQALRRASPPPPVAPPVPAWQEHLHGFMSENGYLVAGILMVLAGCSLLAYFTWDQHWLLRYTIMPALLGGFTWALAGLGRALERRDAMLVGTGAALRGAAIALLPANFMTIALLAGDPAVTGAARLAAIGIMGTLYALAFGAGLVRWCRAVHPALGGPLGGTLLALCALVVTGPIARELGGVGTDTLRILLGVGFYVGFALAAWCATWFTQRVLTREMAGEERVPAFVVATLGITFVEVFAWVHGWAHTLPNVHTYAVLVVGAGALVLLLERRLLELSSRPTAHAKESFLGYALVLGGASMGLGEPTLRPIALAAAGLAWLVQSVAKRDARHDAIGLALCISAGATVGYAPGVVPLVRPWIWLALAAAAAWLARPTRRARWPSLAQAAAGFVPVLALAAVASASTEQWRQSGPPLATAALLLQVAVVAAVRARDEGENAYLDTAALVAAMALPYLGCVDLEHRTPQGNTLAFGLAVMGTAWLGLCAIGGTFARGSRSTVLWLYGMLAVAGMVLRVAFEPAGAESTGWHMGLDYGGPLAMTVLLVIATYTSRSLVPAGMAVAIAAILVPELRTRFYESIGHVGWGSGLGSAIAALVLLLGCFALRGWRALNELGEGDLYLGKRAYPLTRHDHTLFTWPIFTAVAFLIVRTDTVTLVRHLGAGGIGVKTALALALTGVAWWLVAVYQRALRGAVAVAYLGGAWLAAGAAFLVSSPGGRAVLGGTDSPLDWRWSHSALAAAVSLQAAYVVFAILARSRAWIADLLAIPTRRTIAAGAACLSLALALELSIKGVGIQSWMLVAVVAAQLAWMALATGNEAYGALFGMLGWVSLSTVSAEPGAELTLLRIAPGYALAAQLAISLASPWRARLAGLYRPLAVVAVLWCVLPAFTLAAQLATPTTELPAWGTVATMAAAALATGWANRFGPALLLAALLAHVAMLGEQLALVHPHARWALACEPWRLGAWATGVACAGALLRIARRHGVRWIQGPAPLPWLERPYGPWLQLPAAVVAIAAGALHTTVPGWMDEPRQLFGPAGGALAMGIIAAGWRQAGWLPAMLSLLALANVHALRVFFGDRFEAHGLTIGHVIAAGFAATLLMGSLLRRLLAAPAPRVVLRHCGIWLAGAIVALAWVNYAVDPDLSTIRWERFAASGAMIWLAGLYFRAVARRPEELDGVPATVFEGLYHAALALALACVALIIPALRHPNTALAALVLPTLWFHARCELARAADVRARYASSTATLTFLILALYAAYGLVQVAFFPSRPLSTDPYHTSSPLVLVVALSMLRLHRLGGTPWLAFYAGLALMMGSYFALTSLPHCSPFSHPLAGAWCALGLAHAWTVATDERSPLRTALLRLGGIDPAAWLGLRERLGPCQLVLVHTAVASGLVHHAGAGAEATCLLAATSTLLFHHGLRRELSAFFTLGIVELLAAVHGGYVIPDTLIARDHIVGAVLVLWVALLALHRVALTRAWLPAVGTHSAVFAGIAFAHVMFRHGPGSPTGLLAVAAIGLCGLLVPRRGRTAIVPEELAWAQLPLALPMWLAYFAVVPLPANGPEAFRDPQAWLAVAFALLGTGTFALVWQRRLYAAYAQLERVPPRLVDHTLGWLGTGGHNTFGAMLLGGSILVGIVHLGHGAHILPPGVVIPVLFLYLGCIAGWVHEAQARDPLFPITMVQLGVAGALTALRSQAIHLLGHWDPVYDVWTLLVISLGLTAAMDSLGRRAPAVRLPFAVTYYLLPIAGITWCLSQNVGADAMLLVLGLHAMMFGFAGGGSRDSPYTFCGLLGAMAFVVVGFHAKLHLDVVHAYTIPVGVAILALVQMFADKTERSTRDGVRVMALVAMVGPSAWYVFADARYPIGFHLVLLGLSLCLAGAGSVLRIKVFVAAGFLGLFADTATIVVRSLQAVEHGLRMSLLGGVVLALGAALVGGAVYVKTHRDAVSSWLSAIRARLGTWD